VEALKVWRVRRKAGSFWEITGHVKKESRTADECEKILSRMAHNIALKEGNAMGFGLQGPFVNRKFPGAALDKIFAVL